MRCPAHTTDCSAPVLRIGTLILMGPPLGFLPYHRSDRFPRSTQEPDSRSRHLHAGRRPGSKQVSPELIPEYQQPPVLTSSLSFRHLISGSLALASLIIPDPVLRSSLTLTTLALYQRSLRWFEASTCMAASRDLSSSLVQHRTLGYKILWCVRGTLWQDINTFS